MRSLNDRLKESPLISILVILASLATILGFILTFNNKGSQKKNMSTEIYSPREYFVNANENHKVYFYDTPDESTKRNAFFNSKEEVTVTRVENNFGFIRFVNDRGESSTGWVQIKELILKP